MTTTERSETPEADKAMWTCDPDGMGDYRDVVDYEFACSLETRLRKAETELAALRSQRCATPTME